MLCVWVSQRPEDGAISPNPGIQVIVNCKTRVLGTKLLYSVRAMKELSLLSHHFSPLFDLFVSYSLGLLSTLV